MDNQKQIGNIEQKKLTYLAHENEKIEQDINKAADSKTLQAVVILGTACFLMLGVAYYLHTTKPPTRQSFKCAKLHVSNTPVEYL